MANSAAEEYVNSLSTYGFDTAGDTPSILDQLALEDLDSANFSLVDQKTKDLSKAAEEKLKGLLGVKEEKSFMSDETALTAPGMALNTAAGFSKMATNIGTQIARAPKVITDLFPSLDSIEKNVVNPLKQYVPDPIREAIGRVDKATAFVNPFTKYIRDVPNTLAGMGTALDAAVEPIYNPVQMERLQGKVAEAYDKNTGIVDVATEMAKVAVTNPIDAGHMFITQLPYMQALAAKGALGVGAFLGVTGENYNESLTKFKKSHEGRSPNPEEQALMLGTALAATGIEKIESMFILGKLKPNIGNKLLTVPTKVVTGGAVEFGQEGSQNVLTDIGGYQGTLLDNPKLQEKVQREAVIAGGMGAASGSVGGAAVQAIQPIDKVAREEDRVIKQSTKVLDAFKQTEVYASMSKTTEAPVAAYRAFEATLKDEASTPEQKQAAFDTAVGALITTPQFNTQKLATNLTAQAEAAGITVPEEIATVLIDLAKPTMGVIGKTGDVITKGIDKTLEVTGTRKFAQRVRDRVKDKADITDEMIKEDPEFAIGELADKPFKSSTAEDFAVEALAILKTLRKFDFSGLKAEAQAKAKESQDRLLAALKEQERKVNPIDQVVDGVVNPKDKTVSFGSSANALAGREDELTDKHAEALLASDNVSPEQKAVIIAVRKKTTDEVSINVEEKSDTGMISLPEHLDLITTGIALGNKAQAEAALTKLKAFAGKYAVKAAGVATAWKAAQKTKQTQFADQIDPKAKKLFIIFNPQDSSKGSARLVSHIESNNNLIQARFLQAQNQFNVAFKGEPSVTKAKETITPKQGSKEAEVSSTVTPTEVGAGTTAATEILEKLRKRLSEIYKKDAILGSDAKGNYIQIDGLSINDSNIGYYFERAGYQINQSSQTGTVSKFYYKDSPLWRLKYLALRAVGWVEKEIKSFFRTNSTGYSLKQPEVAGYRSPNGTSYSLEIEKFLSDETIDILIKADSTSGKGNNGSIKKTAIHNIQPTQLKDIEKLFAEYLANNIQPKKDDGSAFPYPGNWIAIPALDVLLKKLSNTTAAKPTAPVEPVQATQATTIPPVTPKPAEGGISILKAGKYEVVREIKNLLYGFAKKSILNKKKLKDEKKKELIEAEKAAIAAIPEYTFGESFFTKSNSPIQDFAALFKDNSAKVEKIITLLADAIASSINNTNQLYLSQNPALAFMQDMNDKFSNGDTKLRMPKQVIEAIAIAAFNYMGTQGRSLMMNDVTSLKMMFGIDSQSRVPEEIYGIMTYAGKNINNVNDDIGSEIYNILGISGADEIARKRLQHSLGFMAIKGLQNLGYIQQNPVDKGIYDGLLKLANPEGESDADVELELETGADRVVFVSTKLKRDENKELLIGEDKRVIPMEKPAQLFAIYKQEGLSKDIKDKLDLRGTAIKPRIKKPTDKAIPKFLKNTKQALTEEAIVAVRTANETPYSFNVRTFETFLSVYNDPDLQEALLESLGFVKDLGTVSMYSRKGTHATNQLLLKEIDALIEYYDLLKDKKVDVYFTHYISKVNRVFVDTSSGINPQNSKLVRHFITQNNQDVTLDKSNPNFKQQVEDVQAAIALGFDIDSGNTSRIQVLQKLTEIMTLPEKDGEPSYIKTYLENPSPEALINVLAKYEGKSHTLEAILALEQLQEFLNDEKAASLTLRTTNEVDGKTNGVAIAVAQTFGIAATDLPGVMKQIGLITDGPALQYLSAMEGGLDLYQTIVERWTRFVNERISEVGITEKELTLWKTQQRYLGNLMAEGKVTKEARNMVKYPFMTTIFGKSTRTLYADFGKELTSKIYKKIEDLNKQLREGAFADDIFAEIAQINQDIKILTGKKDNLFPLTVDFIDHKLPKAIEDAIGASVGPTYSEELGNAINAQFSPFFDTRRVLNGAINLIADIFIAMVKKKVGKGQLTKVLLDELIAGDLKEFLPAIKTAYSKTIQEGFQVFKSKAVRTPKNGVEVTYGLGSPISNTPLTEDNIEELNKPTYSHSGGIKEISLENAGVGGLIGLIHSFDGAVMQAILTKLKAFGVHDAAILNALTAQQDSIVMNQVFAELTEKYSIADSIYERFNEIGKALLALSKDPAQTLLDQQQVTTFLNEMSVLLEDKVKKDTSVQVGLKNTIKNIREARSKILPTVISWAQMVGHDSAYVSENAVLPSDVEPSVETLLEEVTLQQQAEDLAKQAYESARNIAIEKYKEENKVKNPRQKTIDKITTEVFAKLGQTKISAGDINQTLFDNMVAFIKADPKNQAALIKALKCRAGK